MCIEYAIVDGLLEVDLGECGVGESIVGRTFDDDAGDFE